MACAARVAAGGIAVLRLTHLIVWLLAQSICPLSESILLPTESNIFRSAACNHRPRFGGFARTPGYVTACALARGASP
jgi:hypothetical protein